MNLVLCYSLFSFLIHSFERNNQKVYVKVYFEREKKYKIVYEKLPLIECGNERSLIPIEVSGFMCSYLQWVPRDIFHAVNKTLQSNLSFWILCKNVP